MEITQRGDYAIRAMTYLAMQKSGIISPVRHIAEWQQVPAPFLRKILQDLCRAGLVLVRRGVFGGYALARSPEQITVLEVIEAVDGPLAFTRCLQENGCPCPLFGRCAAEDMWRSVRDSMVGQLKTYNFAVLSDEQRRLDEEVGRILAMA